MKTENVSNTYYVNEVYNCTFVKCFLMLLVTFYHSCALWMGNWIDREPVFESPILSHIANWLNSFHVYGFVLVSGYLFYYLKNECGKYGNFIKFVKNKIKRLLIPYYAVTVFWIIPMDFLIGKKITIVKLIRYFAGASGQLWFLWMLFLVYMLGWILADFMKKHNILSTVGIIMMFLIYAVFSGKIPNVFQILHMMKYFPLFWIGFKLRQYREKIPNISSLILVLIDLLLYVVVCMLSNSSIRFILELFLNICGALMSFFILQKLAQLPKWSNNRMINYLSKRSMLIYLFHQQIIYLSIVWLNGKVFPCLNALANFCIAIVGSLFLANIVLKFKITKILVGETNQ